MTHEKAKQTTRPFYSQRWNRRSPTNPDATECDGKSTTEYREAIEARADRWVPACNGLEVPFATKAGRMVLYCFNPATRRHGYLDIANDTIMDDEAISLELTQ